MSANLSTEWKRFKSQWQNYEIAADLTDKSAEKRAAVFLACVSTEAYELFETFKFNDECDQKKIDGVMKAFEDHFIGETNVRYERYTFNRQVQRRNLESPSTCSWKICAVLLKLVNTAT